MKYSIIIPVYNTPVDFFERCLKSIVKQMTSDCEIIVIDDGSIENKSKNYERICGLTPEIFYWRQNNEGVSSARNCGLDRAQGEYCLFVDGDDVITDNCFETIEYFIKAYPDADLIAGKICYNPTAKTDQNYDKVKVFDQNTMSELKIDMFVHQFTGEKPMVLGSPCARVYKTALARKIGFPIGVTHYEDQIFNRKYLNECGQAVIIPDKLYIYYQNPFSAMYTKQDYIEKMNPFWKAWDELNEEEEDAELRRALLSVSIDLFYTAVHCCLMDENLTRKACKEKMTDVYDETLFRNAIRQKEPLELKNKIRFFLMKHKLIYIAMTSVNLKNKLFRR